MVTSELLYADVVNAVFIYWCGVMQSMVGYIVVNSMVVD